MMSFSIHIAGRQGIRLSWILWESSGLGRRTELPSEIDCLLEAAKTHLTSEKTPALLMDKRLIRAKYEEFRTCFTKARVYYAQSPIRTPASSRFYTNSAVSSRYLRWENWNGCCRWAFRQRGSPSATR
jgi:hypothetical protein